MQENQSEQPWQEHEEPEKIPSSPPGSEEQESLQEQQETRPEDGAQD